MLNYAFDIPIGIDLGTTFSCIGYWNNNEVVLIPNSVGEFLTPSVVVFNENEIIVGEQAQKILYPKGEKIYAIKRIIGRNFTDPTLSEEIKNFTYKITNKNNYPQVEIKKSQKTYSPIEISSLILKKLINSAEKFLEREIKKVVISVPAIFNDAQRTATKTAAEKIGLEVLGIINEPTAAALAYGFCENKCHLKTKYKNNFVEALRISRNENLSTISEISEDNNLNIDHNDNKEKYIMVFDLGGGTYDLAILKLKNDFYEVLSKYTDKNLGGEDFDNELMNYALRKFGKSLKNANNKNEKLFSKESKERLKKACELVKRLLSKEEEAIIKVANFYQDADLNIQIKRKDFEDEICKELFEKLSQPFKNLLNEANLTFTDINEVILVGGSSKMPKIKKILEMFFTNKKINNSINPDELVAYGATIKAALLLSKDNENHHCLKDLKLVDITPLSLGTDVLENGEEIVKVLINKGSKIPATETKEYITSHDNQEDMLVCVYEGESKYKNKNNLLGKFKITNLPKKNKGEVRCEITFSIDENNILTVTGREKTQGKNCGIKIINNKQVNLDYEDNEINEQFYSGDDDENKNYKSYTNKIKILSKGFSRCNNEEDKYNILKKYENITIKLIETIDISKFNNENIIEKYYLYVYQLFEGYVEMLFLDKEIIKANNVEKELRKSIQNYIKNLKNGNIYYIKSLINLFENTRKKSSLFYRLILDEIKIFNEIGLSYLDFEHKKKYSRYYAKLYFTESTKLFNKYITEEVMGELLDDYDEILSLKAACTKKLEEINNNAIILIRNSNKSRKLFEPTYIAQQLNNQIESGFTIYEQLYFYSEKTNDEYIIILDQYENTLAQIELALKDKDEFENACNELREEKAICLGSIVKIKYKYLGYKKYDEYLKIIGDCLVIAKKLYQNENECEWYKEAKKLKEELEKKVEEQKNLEDKNFIDNYKEKLDEVINKNNEIFKHDNKIDFINYILANFEYEGYANENIGNLGLNWMNINLDLVQFLIKKYNIDKYPKKTAEERYKHRIIEDIIGKLHNLERMLKTNRDNY